MQAHCCNAHYGVLHTAVFPWDESLFLIPIQQVIMPFNNLSQFKKKKIFQCLSQMSELHKIQNGGLIVTMISSQEKNDL